MSTVDTVSSQGLLKSYHYKTANGSITARVRPDGVLEALSADGRSGYFIASGYSSAPFSVPRRDYSAFEASLNKLFREIKKHAGTAAPFKVPSQLMVLDESL